ncbi:hypothetical protein MMC24_007291 [Lignoscripta atroalba]|nr:hypothetical protein [Lignoscripta atroalba]
MAESGPSSPDGYTGVKEESFLCTVCQEVDFEQLFWAEELPDSNAVTTWEVVVGIGSKTTLGNAKDIFLKAKCPFCRLVTKTLRPRIGDTNPTVMLLSSTDDRGHVQYETNAPPRLVHIAFYPGRYFAPTYQWDYVCVSAKGGAPSIYGHHISAGGVNFALLRRWIDQCETNHQGLCNRPGWTLKAHGTTKMRVIDVRARRVIEVPRNSRYITLSYVWGPRTLSPQPFRATTAEFYKGEDGDLVMDLPNQLPRTIEDALYVTAMLGERFLWVDSLCIIQDDESDKKAEIANMDRIYSGSFVTIVAASGSDANAGLPHVRPGSRGIQQHTETVGDLQLVIALAGLSAHLATSKWISRAWTFQEGLLTRRRLIFTDEQVFYECVKGRNCEAISASRRYTILDNSLHLTAPGQEWEFKVYDQLLQLYKDRALSYESDSINAFAGIIKAMERLHNVSFLWGLPEMDFESALLWQLSDTSEQDHILQRRGQFPSWSWAGWSGSLNHDLVMNPWGTGPDDLKEAPMTQAVCSFYKQYNDGTLDKIGQQSDAGCQFTNYLYFDTHLARFRLFMESMYHNDESTGSLVLLGIHHDEASKVASTDDDETADTVHLETADEAPPSSTQSQDCDSGDGAMPSANSDSSKPHASPQPGYKASKPPHPISQTYGPKICEIEVQAQKARTLSGQLGDFIILSRGSGRGFKYSETFWDLYNVMLIEWRGGVAYRLGVAQIPVSAWEETNQQVMSIKLG